MFQRDCCSGATCPVPPSEDRGRRADEANGPRPWSSPAFEHGYRVGELSRGRTAQARLHRVLLEADAVLAISMKYRLPRSTRSGGRFEPPGVAERWVGCQKCGTFDSAQIGVTGVIFDLMEESCESLSVLTTALRAWVNFELPDDKATADRTVEFAMHARGASIEETWQWARSFSTRWARAASISRGA